MLLYMTPLLKVLYLQESDGEWQRPQLGAASTLWDCLVAILFFASALCQHSSSKSTKWKIQQSISFCWRVYIEGLSMLF